MKTFFARCCVAVLVAASVAPAFGQLDGSDRARRAKTEANVASLQSDIAAVKAGTSPTSMTGLTVLSNVNLSVTASNVTATTAVKTDAIDARTGTTLAIGGATATGLDLGSAGITTASVGDFYATRGLATGLGATIGNGGKFIVTANAINVTNNHALTATSGVYRLSGIGSANDNTNTLTLAAPATGGQFLILAVATASTNLITIADSAPVASSGALLLDADDTALLISLDNATWVLVSKSDN